MRMSYRSGDEPFHQARHSFLSRANVAENIADDSIARARDRLKALELLARIGLRALDAA